MEMNIFKKLMVEVETLIMSVFAPMNIDLYLKDNFFQGCGSGSLGEFRQILDKNYQKIGIKKWRRLKDLHALLNGIIITNPYGYTYGYYSGDAISNELWRYLPPSICFNVDNRIFWVRNLGDDVEYYEVYEDGYMIRLNSLKKILTSDPDDNYSSYKVLTNIALCYWAWYDELRLRGLSASEQLKQRVLPPLPNGLQLSNNYNIVSSKTIYGNRHYKTHIVRGHYRYYKKSGKRIWIAQHWAGQNMPTSIPIYSL